VVKRCVTGALIRFSKIHLRDAGLSCIIGWAVRKNRNERNVTG